MAVISDWDRTTSSDWEFLAGRLSYDATNDWIENNNGYGTTAQYTVDGTTADDPVVELGDDEVAGRLVVGHRFLLEQDPALGEGGDEGSDGAHVAGAGRAHTEAGGHRRTLRRWAAPGAGVNQGSPM